MIRLVITYTHLSVTATFEISGTRTFTFTTVSPVQHTCTKKYKTLQEVADHLRLSNTSALVFITAYKANAKANPQDWVTELHFTSTAKDVECSDLCEDC